MPCQRQNATESVSHAAVRSNHAAGATSSPGEAEDESQSTRGFVESEYVTNQKIAGTVSVSLIGHGQTNEQRILHEPAISLGNPPTRIVAVARARGLLLVEDDESLRRAIGRILEPRGYHLEEHSRKGLWIPGVVIGGVFYGFSLMAAVSSTREEDRILALPVAGPVIRLVGETEGGTRTLLTLDAMGQVTGVVLTYLGFALTKKVWVQDYELDLAVLPTAPGTDRGMSLVARF